MDMNDNDINVVPVHGEMECIIRLVLIGGDDVELKPASELHHCVVSRSSSLPELKATASRHLGGTPSRSDIVLACKACVGLRELREGEILKEEETLFVFSSKRWRAYNALIDVSWEVKCVERDGDGVFGVYATAKLKEAKIEYQVLAGPSAMEELRAHIASVVWNLQGRRQRGDCTPFEVCFWIQNSDRIRAKLGKEKWMVASLRTEFADFPTLLDCVGKPMSNITAWREALMSGRWTKPKPKTGGDKRLWVPLEEVKETQLQFELEKWRYCDQYAALLSSCGLETEGLKTSLKNEFHDTEMELNGTYDKAATTYKKEKCHRPRYRHGVECPRVGCFCFHAHSDELRVFQSLKTCNPLVVRCPEDQDRKRTYVLCLPTSRDVARLCAVDQEKICKHYSQKFLEKCEEFLEECDGHISQREILTYLPEGDILTKDDILVVHGGTWATNGIECHAHFHIEPLQIFRQKERKYITEDGWTFLFDKQSWLTC